MTAEVVGVVIAHTAAADIRLYGTMFDQRSGSLYGRFDEDANEVRVEEALPGVTPSQRGLELVGGFWEDPTSVGRRPELADEQAAIWASYLSDELPRYAAVIVVPESEPNPEGWAPPAAVAWVARTVGPIGTAVLQAPVRFEREQVAA